MLPLPSRDPILRIMGMRTRLLSYGKVFDAGKQEKRRGGEGKKDFYPSKGNRRGKKFL
jgi:hypothetical protein